MLIVSYFTPDYAEYAERMRKSCEKFGYEHRIEAMEDVGFWVDNCARKGRFMLDRLREAGETLLWLDADAEIMRPLDYLEKLDGFDFAIFRKYDGPQRQRFWSGTLLVAPTKRTEQLLSVWADLCDRQSHIWDQENLFVAWMKLAKNLRAVWLPLSYCQRFDEKERSGNGVDDPHIIHYQVSREMRPKKRRPDKRRPIRKRVRCGGS